MTAQAIKARYLGEDEQHKTLLELVTYHNENMISVLQAGTLENHFTTERYIKRYLEYKLKIGDIYLKQISYKFIIDFEQFLRTGVSINRSQPLNNNGVMKHLERIKKLINLALRLEWIEKDSFLKLKFVKHQRAYLFRVELEIFESGYLPKPMHKKIRDVFVLSVIRAYPVLMWDYSTGDNIAQGIYGNHWIYTKRENNEEPIKMPLLKSAMDILNKLDQVLLKYLT